MTLPSHGTNARADATVEVDSEARNVALLIDGREYVFSAGTLDIAAKVELLEGWADTCRLAAAALRRCHTRLLSEHAVHTEIANAGITVRTCTLCDSPNATPRTSCHWCGNPLSHPEVPNPRDSQRGPGITRA